MKYNSENKKYMGGEYVPPQVNVIQMVTSHLMATSWNNGEIQGDLDDLYDDEL